MKDFFKTSSCGNIPIPRNHLANFDFLSESTFSLSILCLCFGCFSFALLFLHLLAFFIFSSFNPVLSFTHAGFFGKSTCFFVIGLVIFNFFLSLDVFVHFSFIIFT
jgi:hypothetical protein